MQKLTIILLTFTLLFSGLAIAAQETEEIALDEDVSADDLGVNEPTLLPDSPFYFFKTWGREIRSVFTFDPVKKAELRERFANEKLVEVKKMVEQNKNREQIEKAVQNYRQEIGEVARVTERIREKAEENEQVGSFLDKYTQHQLLHQRVLKKLEEQVPAEAMEKIRETREEHLERFGEVMTKLENNSDQIRERLEKNLREVKGGEFKDFKNLETLKDLEEKVPEAAKEAIQRAGESSLQRLKTTVENMTPEAFEKFNDYTERVSGDKDRQLNILRELNERLEKAPAIQQKIIESSERIQERIEVKERERATENTQSCIQLWDPVCGKDGKTYSNKCFAKVAGAEVNYKGRCKEKPLEIKPEPEKKPELEEKIETPDLTPAQTQFLTKMKGCQALGVYLSDIGIPRLKNVDVGLGERAKCIRDAAKELKNEIFCRDMNAILTLHSKEGYVNHLEPKYYQQRIDNWKDNCYKELALHLDKMSLCENIQSSFYASECYTPFAVNSGNIEYCRKIPLDNREFCLLEVVEKNENIIDYTICQDILDSVRQGRCYLVIASRVEDSSICEAIIDVVTKDMCFLKVAPLIKNKLICEKITDSMIRKACENKF